MYVDNFISRHLLRDLLFTVFFFRNVLLIKSPRNSIKALQEEVSNVSLLTISSKVV